MRKLITLAACVLGVMTASAQTGAYTLANVQKATDTLSASSSTDTVDMYTPLKYLNGNNGVFAVHFTATKISGTVSGNAILQASTNGTDWNNVGTSADTFALQNVATLQSKQWFVQGVKTNRIRVRILAPSSTQAVQVKTRFIKD